MKETIFVVEDESQLPALMPELAEALGNCRKVALYGEMGAGKTTLVRAFCTWLGVRENPASPTFSLVNEYSYPDGDQKIALVRHLDLYRLKNAAEVLDLGLEEYLDDETWCFVEWPQMAEALFPPEYARIEIEAPEEKKRRIRVWGC